MGGGCLSDFVSRFSLLVSASRRLSALCLLLSALPFLQRPAFAFANGEDASYVLGQANFTSGGSAVTQSGMQNSSGGGGGGRVAYDSANARFFVSDYVRRTA